MRNDTFFQFHSRHLAKKTQILTHTRHVCLLACLSDDGSKTQQELDNNFDNATSLTVMTHLLIFHTDELRTFPYQRLISTHCFFLGSPSLQSYKNTNDESTPAWMTKRGNIYNTQSHGKLTLQTTIVTSLANTVSKTDSDGSKETEAEECWAPLIVVDNRPAFSDLCHSPKV